MAKRGSVKGTIMKIIMTNGYTLDFDIICKLVFKQVPDTTIGSIRGALYTLVKDGYLDKIGTDTYKATQAFRDGMFDNNFSKSTVDFICN